MDRSDLQASNLQRLIRCCWSCIAHKSSRKTYKGSFGRLVDPGIDQALYSPVQFKRVLLGASGGQLHKHLIMIDLTTSKHWGYIATGSKPVSMAATSRNSEESDCSDHVPLPMIRSKKPGGLFSWNHAEEASNLSDCNLITWLPLWPRKRGSPLKHSSLSSSIHPKSSSTPSPIHLQQQSDHNN
ncbi:hypothetical protein PGTUg99_032601 [Puccinia graminis f. sp. tritici]|uniref:Uncharacterized protein n=1 Tax=Puccinia graminis f. sp. tritici TaxID=56615 RepID=A0A5B0RR13_PUCGR|nr:hypothetical protein PGTUg99_032601 [Puccinia graminis f. sp. tritici]